MKEIIAWIMLGLSLIVLGIDMERFGKKKTTTTGWTDILAIFISLAIWFYMLFG